MAICQFKFQICVHFFLFVTFRPLYLLLLNSHNSPRVLLRSFIVQPRVHLLPAITLWLTVTAQFITASAPACQSWNFNRYFILHSALKLQLLRPMTTHFLHSNQNFFSFSFTNCISDCHGFSISH